jgi:hypothetical protein
MDISNERGIALLPLRARLNAGSARVAWLLGMLLVLALAAAIRVSFARYSLWSDELASVFFARQPLSNLWGGWMVRETNPPLYYSLLQSWIEAVGLSTLKLRLFSVAGGLLAIIVTYYGIGQNYSKRAGLIAALMLALSAQQLNFSLMVRSYIFLYLAVSISFFGLLAIVRSLDKPNLKGWVAYVGGAIAGVYLHTTACIWPIAATLSLIAVDRRFRPLVGRRWLELVLADALVVAGASWWLYITYLQLRGPNGNISWIVWPGMRETASYFFSTVLLSRDTTGWAKIIPMGVAMFAIVGVVRTSKSPVTRMTIACPIVAVLLFILLSLKQPVIMDRTILWVSIFPLTLAAVGLDSIRNRWFFGATTAAMLLSLGVNLANSSQNLKIENWSDAVRAISRDPRAVLVVDGESMGVSANIACAVDLGSGRCPFPVVTVQRSDDVLDPWAFGYAGKTDASPDGRLALPRDANVYLFRRKSHDVLATLHRVQLLQKVDTAQPNMLGPYGPPFAESVVARIPFRNGLLRVSQ